MTQGYSVFISAVTREFGAARAAVANALVARGIDVKVQHSFNLHDGTTLEKLHDYIKGCDRVLAVVGAYCGAFPPEGAVTDAFRAMLPEGMTRASLTQWEVIFAWHHGVQTYFFEAMGFDPEKDVPKDDDTAAQAAWRHWLFDGGIGRDRAQFQSADGLRADVMGLRWPDSARPSNLPVSIRHLFKGREAFLKTLRGSFRHNPATAITGKAVHGLGGVGKTRTAIEYGHAYAAEYAATFFLTGKSENDLKDSLAALAGAAMLDLAEQDVPNLELRVAAVVRWLRANPDWLLIIDNVDDEPAASAVLAFLDQVSLGKGHVLITSRVGDWGQAVESLELDLLSLDAAKDLLRESTPNRTKSPDEDVALTRLADEQLGCLSLALVQAAAYVEERRIGFADYAELFEKEAAKLLAKLGAAAVRKLRYPLPVALTWQATFAQLSDAGRLLLDMLAWLSIEPIPRDLLAVWPQADTIDLGEGLAELTRYSFVHWEAENTAFTVHRLVAQVTRDNMDEKGRDRALGALFAWLASVNAGRKADDARSWPQVLPLLPHLLFLFGRTEGRGPYPGQVRLHNETGLLLKSLARYSEAEHLYRRVLLIIKENFKDDRENLAIVLNNLAALLQDVHRLPEAEPLIREALAIDEAHFGPDHPSVASRLNNLAQLLRATERMDEAEPLMRRALAIDESSLGPNHPSVAIRLSNLAQLLQATGRNSEAEPMMVRALKIDEAEFGPDHPILSIRLNNLGLLMVYTNRLSEAEPLFNHAAKILLKVSKDSGHILPNMAPVLRNYYAMLIEAGLDVGEALATIAGLMSEVGFDAAELQARVFGGDSENTG